MSSGKIQEANEHCRAAERHLKITIMRWKPDFDSAADEYSQAAQCYRIARELSKSKDCHLKASDHYLRNNCYFHAAKSLENAMLVHKESSSAEEIYCLALKSASLYQQHGSGDSAANVLARAAKIIEESSPEKSCTLYQKAADVSATESSTHQGIDYTSRATRLLVRLGLYDKAADSVRREIGYHLEARNYGSVGRLTVVAVLIQLAREDVVAAEKCYREWGSNCEASENETLERLLTAYDEEDREEAKRALASPFIRNMDVEYARLAARLELPKGELAVRKVDVSGQAGAPDADFEAGAAGTSAAFQAGVAGTSAAQPRFEDIEESPYEAASNIKTEVKVEEEDEGDFC